MECSVSCGPGIGSTQLPQSTLPGALAQGGGQGLSLVRKIIVEVEQLVCSADCMVEGALGALFS